MASENIKTIFLSASIPLKERDPKYYKTADIIAIRDAVIALASIVLPMHKLIWGGHPSITPIFYYVMEKLAINNQEHMILYQSKYFEHLFHKDNNVFRNVVLTESTGEMQSSILLMRKRMFSENEIVAGVFIGGMEGVEDEYKMLLEFHPNAILLPIASTGAAALFIYERSFGDKEKYNRLFNDYAYLSLFQDLLINKI